jgi:signal peptidase I
VEGPVLTGEVASGSRPSVPARYRTAGPNPVRRAAVVILAIAVTVALIRALLVQQFVVPTGSMTPTVHVGDRLMVSRLSYTFGSIHRGDIIVFNGAGVFDPEVKPSTTLLQGLGRAVAAAFSLPIGSHDYVKRVIGLPGDRVICCNAQGRITVNGTALSESYLPAGTKPSLISFDVVVPQDRLWVLGDNRGDSADSRAYLGRPGGGTVPTDKVVGRAVAVYWPLSRAGSLGPTRSAFAGVAGPAGDERKEQR